VHALIIEDEFLTAQLIRDYLAELAFTSFAFAMDEEEAVAVARECCPDLITSDVLLSRGCGIDAVQRICELKPIAVLYITGSAMMVRERLGVKTFDEVTAPDMQRLIREGSSEELIRWLEAHPAK
jgi:CheY-like chemotaxis protein